MGTLLILFGLLFIAAWIHTQTGDVDCFSVGLRRWRDDRPAALLILLALCVLLACGGDATAQCLGGRCAVPVIQSAPIATPAAQAAATQTVVSDQGVIVQATSQPRRRPVIRAVTWPFRAIGRCWRGGCR